MRLKDYGTSVVLWLSARDTEDWADKPGGKWPCSELAGKRLVAAFDDNGLYDLTVDGRYGVDISTDEFNVLTSDYLATRLPKDHPCWFVTVGQFQGEEDV